MSIEKSYSAQLIGLRAELITIEVDITNGLHAFSVVGLGDRSIEESKDRISAAIKNSGFVSPKQKNQKVVISMAPADIKKEGSCFDLAMALAYLKASREIDAPLNEFLILGELSLEGKVRKISGLLPILCQTNILKFNKIIIPESNREEASLTKDLEIYPVSSLKDAVEHLSSIKQIEKISHYFPSNLEDDFESDMQSIKGNETAKRGLEIAAAGAHNVIMCGPPGTGKTMLAKSFGSVLPALSYDHSVEITSIHSAAGILGNRFILRPPFRSPHHTASYAAIVGGGIFPKPGEITLAHRGILFLDEFPEFDRKVLESLRQPLEEREISVSRARGTLTFPAQCILIAAMNPCPCGKGKQRGCECSTYSIERYWRKLSGPILDRIDIFLNVEKVDYDQLSGENIQNETSQDIRRRIEKARSIQSERFRSWNSKKLFNCELNSKELDKLSIDKEAKEILLTSSKTLNLSGRAFHKIIKVSQTIADLENSSSINKKHILESLQFRNKNMF